MKDINGEIQYKDKTYKLIFNLNVMEQIQEEYGSIAEWGEKTDAENEPDAKAVKFGFWCMMNEAIDIQNEEDGTDMEPLTLKQVGRIITEYGLVSATKTMNETVIASTESTEKNA